MRRKLIVLLGIICMLNSNAVKAEEQLDETDKVLFRQNVECDDLNLKYYFEFEYDSNGRKIARKEYSETGSLNATIEYVYNELGLIEQEVDYSASGTVDTTTDCEYDSNGNIIKETINDNEDVSERIYQYDLNGKLIKKNYISSGGSKSSWMYLYEGDRLVEIDVERDGVREVDEYYTYDADGKVVSTLGPDKSGYQYEYDENGLKIKETLVVNGEPYLVSTFEYRSLDEAEEEEIYNIEIIKLVQEALNEKGFECGVVDGIAGNTTKSAIIDFMKSIGEESSGKITNDVIDKLDIEDAVYEIRELLKFRTDLTYEQLIRNPLDYIGEKVKFSGTVLQVINTNGNNKLRIAMNSDSNQCILCSYSRLDMNNTNIIEGDKLVIYGISEGTEDYISVAGIQLTVPSVMVERIECDYGIFKVFPGFS